MRSTGVQMGEYSAPSADSAIEAMHLDAGYAGTEGAARDLDTTIEALRDGLYVTPGVRRVLTPPPPNRRNTMTTLATLIRAQW